MKRSNPMMFKNLDLLRRPFFSAAGLARFLGLNEEQFVHEAWAAFAFGANSCDQMKFLKKGKRKRRVSLIRTSKISLAPGVRKAQGRDTGEAK